MAVVKHGVSTNTPDRIVIDAGAVYTGWTSVASPGTLLGATRGGSVFELNRTFREMPVDGARGKVKMMERRERIEASLTVNLLEITEANLLIALSGASAAAHVITGGEIASGDYISKVALVATVTGFDGTSAPIVLVLDNATVEGPLTMNLSDKDETVVQLKFVAHYLASDLDTEPWSITYPS